MRLKTLCASLVNLLGGLALFRSSSDVELSVEAEKGFFYSPVDECFVCQKKNHFQVCLVQILHTLIISAQKYENSVVYNNILVLC